MKRGKKVISNVERNVFLLGKKMAESDLLEGTSSIKRQGRGSDHVKELKNGNGEDTSDKKRNSLNRKMHQRKADAQEERANNTAAGDSTSSRVMNTSVGRIKGGELGH